MRWQRTSETSMRCDPWTVARVKVKGVFFYELWHDKQPAAAGRYASFEVAKVAAENFEKDGQG